ncbi:hypothetical protein AAON49_08265 [Pseudotenacibaculum sp. MALMAid0570]|uniref:hypothetical protein n=1 Tax=Pseudotenacibaculum sp. MALMAid0570 TaxID=3143938 RepID=UPI0032DFFE8B
MENNSKHTEDWLSKLPKDSGFEVPQGYFDQVEDVFSMNLKEKSFPKHTGFETPSDYFVSLEDRILENVELPKKGKVIPLRTRIAKFSSTAAAAIILLFATYIYFDREITVDPTSDEISTWIDENIETILTDDIVNAFEDGAELENSFVFENTFESDNIEKYIDENDTYILIEETQGLFDKIN